MIVAIHAFADSRVVVHGVENRLARFQCEEMRQHGTKLVGVVAQDADALSGWSPNGLPVFASIAEARAAAQRLDISMIFSAPLAAKSEAAAAIQAGVKTIICFSEHVPVHDALAMRAMAAGAGATLIGPNSSGVLSPGLAKVGFFVEDICRPGPFGIVAKSGSLAYAVMAEMKSADLGVSTVVSIGGDIAKGTDFREHLAAFEADPQTLAMVLLGEIGGADEENAAAFIATTPIRKPVIAFVTGRSVPVGHGMGHAGAIARLGYGDFRSKCAALKKAGVAIATNIGEIPLLLRLCLQQA